MCSCDVHSLNLGLGFAVSGRGQLWWLSQCQLFRACLDSVCMIFVFSFVPLFLAHLIFCLFCIYFICFGFGFYWSSGRWPSKFSLLWYLPFPPTVAASLWCKDSVLSWIQGKREGGNQVKWMPSTIWVFDAHACVAEMLSCICLIVARLRICKQVLRKPGKSQLIK